MLCVHCERRPVTRLYSLCFLCFRHPNIRRRHGGNNLDEDGYDYLPPLPAPTKAMPGTPEKFAVLCARHDSRRQLFHPRDARDMSRDAELLMHTLTEDYDP